MREEKKRCRRRRKDLWEGPFWHDECDPKSSGVSSQRRPLRRVIAPRRHREGFFFLRRRWFSGLSARLNGFGWVRRTIWKKKTQTKKRIKDTETSVMEIHGLLLLRHHRWRWWTWVIAWISSLIAAMGIELFPIFPKQLGMNRNRHSEHHRGIKVKSIWFPYLKKKPTAPDWLTNGTESPTTTSDLDFWWKRYEWIALWFLCFSDFLLFAFLPFFQRRSRASTTFSHSHLNT